MLTAEVPAADLDRDAVGRALARLVAVCDLLHEESSGFLGDWAAPKPIAPSPLLERYAAEVAELAVADVVSRARLASRPPAWATARAAAGGPRSSLRSCSSVAWCLAPSRRRRRSKASWPPARPRSSSSRPSVACTPRSSSASTTIGRARPSVASPPTGSSNVGPSPSPTRPRTSRSRAAVLACRPRSASETASTRSPSTCSRTCPSARRPRSASATTCPTAAPGRPARSASGGPTSASTPSPTATIGRR